MAAKPDLTASEDRPDESQVSEFRDLRDPRAMRALAHPIRMELIEALALDGPLTATEAGARIGESATTCSFHLRQLAKYGFVEDAGPGGTRQRPWRLTSIGNSIPEFTGEADVDLASDVLTKIFLERYIDRVRRAWYERHDYQKEWQDATGFDQAVLFVTVEEMTELRTRLGETLFQYIDRIVDVESRPPGARPVELVLSSYLMRPHEVPR